MVLQVKPASIMFFVLLFAIVILAAVIVCNDDETETVQAVAQSGPVLIVDPGHGGADGGAVSISGTPESSINLQIAKMLKALADFTATPCVMTRESEELDYPPEATSIAKMKAADQKQRITLINSLPNGVLVSIHQNFYKGQSPRGPQTFYGKVEGSQALAETAQEYLNRFLLPESRRVAAPINGNLLIFKKVNCPSLLAECGFLSNPTEAQLLETGEHQLKAAVALMSAYLCYISN